MQNQSLRLAIYSFTHFWVDFACACLIYSSVMGGDWLICLLLYNFCAFALQMPFGLLVDRLDRNAWFASLGCFLIIAAFLCRPLPFILCIVAGVGNAMFHVGGGLDVLNDSFAGRDAPRSGPLGIFVSPGALGLFFGRMAGQRYSEFLWVPAGILCISVVLILSVNIKKNQESSPNSAFSPQIEARYIWPAVCLFLVVCIRSYTGMSMNFDWKSDGLWGIGLVSAVVLGKAAGGYLADWIGAAWAAMLTLGLSAILFLFSPIPFLGILAVFFFNMTMPITLCALAKYFPGAKGFSFGILTFALFLGFLPIYLNAGLLFNVSWGFSLCCGISMFLLWMGLHKRYI